ncbi:MAG: hypothetical protein IT370_21345 [Deltaproteobacteria bacterium]|nr:hypothetical protein [Deltaproteobacteria bacterium]
MATKAQEFKARTQRAAKPARSKKPRPPRRDTPVDTAQSGVSATDRKVGAGNSGVRNISTSAGKRGGPRLEASLTGKPSRKSTRKSQGRVKAAVELTRRATRKTASPKARYARAKARKK